MTMWGEVAELKEDLATAHCYCEYSKLEEFSSITWGDKEATLMHVPEKVKQEKKRLLCGRLFHFIGKN